jgi:hypothetical protein
VTAVVGAAALAVLGTGIAVATTTTHPVTLCVGKNGAVTFPSSGSCSGSQTTLRVAADSDLAALAGRVDTAESKQSSDEAAISSLQSTVSSLSADLEAAKQAISQQGSAITALTSSLTADEALLRTLPRLTVTSAATSSVGPQGFTQITVAGANLQPGSDVVAHLSPNDSGTVGQVAADGTFQWSSYGWCPEIWDVYVTGTAVGGNIVSSNLIRRPAGCS